jgi:hypothetical protein
MGLLPIGRIKHIFFRRVTSRLRDWQVDVVKQPHGPVALHVAEGVVTTMGQQKYAVLMPLEAFLALLLSYQMVHIHDFIEGELQRARGFASRNLRDAARTHTLQLPCHAR